MPYDPLAAPQGPNAAWALSPESDAAWNDLLKSMLLRQAVEAGDLNLQAQRAYTDQMQPLPEPAAAVPGTAAPGLDYAAGGGGGAGHRPMYPGEKISDYVKAMDKYDAELRAAGRKAAEPPKPAKEPRDYRKEALLKALIPKTNKLNQQPVVIPEATRQEIAKSFGYKNLEEALANRPVESFKTSAKAPAAPTTVSPAKAAEDPYAMFPHQPWVDNMLKQGMTPDEIIQKVVTPMPAITPAQKEARQQAFHYLEAKANEMLVSVPPAPPTQFPGRPDTGTAPLNLQGFMPLDVRMTEAAKQAQTAQPPPIAPPVPPGAPATTSGMMPQAPSSQEDATRQIVRKLRKTMSDEQIKQYADLHPNLKSIILDELGTK